LTKDQIQQFIGLLIGFDTPQKKVFISLIGEDSPDSRIY